ncbi:YwqG family protein [Dactylosporangium fulvum]|uniref:YwqG family protein n=1 Tax=Dactylosporangium fulvum TaxID=53359 RepID=A0ABY5W9D4_9ACTN|nr:YwqG family protein [Dactylosporangium fulvum]UWP85288.1 YwqG family protein [Dactylosporangium fulvum]
MRSDDDLVALARQHLPADVAERWLALRRPAVGLAPVPVGDVLTPVVGHLGGEPELPEDLPWPVAGDGLPLYHVASVDCGALPPEAAAMGVPARGRLVFFVDEGLFDDAVRSDEEDDFNDELGALPPADAARLVHVPTGQAVRRRGTPERGNAYERIRLGAWIGATAPAPGHPTVRRTLGDAVTAPGHPLQSLRFAAALAGAEPDHRLGGYPGALRHAVELDAAAAALGGDVGWRDPALHEEALQWRLLAQFDRSDPDIAWHGDDAVLLSWLMRADDLAAGRFDRAVFTFRRPYRG